MKSSVTLVVAVVIAASAGVAVADSGPLADAGLDQEVSVNTTVQLDGTGSSHPNGTIDDYEWSIETPDGREVTPDCATCARTRFTPREPGRYDVTLVVTDSEGRTDSDTLYVYVEDAGPSVQLDGPTEVPIDEPTTYGATAETTNADLERITWTVGNETVSETSISGESGQDEHSLRFADPGTYRVEVVVRDSTNRTARDVLFVEAKGFDSGDDPETGTDDSSESGGDTGTTVLRGESDCGFESGPASAGVACVGNPTENGTSTATSGYNTACENFECSSGAGGSEDGKGDELPATGGQHDNENNETTSPTDDGWGADWAIDVHSDAGYTAI